MNFLLYFGVEPPATHWPNAIAALLDDSTNPAK